MSYPEAKTKAPSSWRGFGRRALAPALVVVALGWAWSLGIAQDGGREPGADDGGRGSAAGSGDRKTGSTGAGDGEQTPAAGAGGQQETGSAGAGDGGQGPAAGSGGQQTGSAGANDNELSDAAKRGRYVFHAAGCASCHRGIGEDATGLEGGQALASPFGTFYAPNISPHEETGIGAWTEADFVSAVTEGVTPDGSPYYPIFPYPWYAGMHEDDARDLWAYVKSTEPVANRVPDHDLDFPLNLRPLVWLWRLVGYDESPERVERAEKDEWNRGAYLVNALAHCGACHTPQNAFQVWQSEERFLAGFADIPGDHPAPNITPHEQTGIGEWTIEEIERLLKGGIRPSGKPVLGKMAAVVADSTARLTDADRHAIAVYLKGIPPIRHEVDGSAEQE